MLKRTPIKKVSKNRVYVTPATYDFVVNRDKHRCVLCGASEFQTKLDLHHINGRSKLKTNDVDNCVMLCHNCHINVVHRNQAKYRPILEKYIANTKLENIQEDD